LPGIATNLTDPFTAVDPGFEPYDGPPLNSSELSQPDLTPTTLKRWLRSDEGIAELPPPTNPRFVKWERTPERGLHLIVSDGVTTTLYEGPEDELRKIARISNRRAEFHRT
jgi:hypothetical protein